MPEESQVPIEPASIRAVITEPSTTPPSETPAPAGEKTDDQGIINSEDNANSDKSGNAPDDKEAPATPAAEALTAESFTAPEGMKLDSEVMPGFLELLNNKALTPNELGQKLLNLQADTLKKAQETASEQWDAEQTAAAKELKEDPVVGQGNFDANLAKIKTLMDSTATPEVRQKLYEHGLANDKDIFSWLLGIQNRLGEGGPTPPSNPADTTKPSLETMLYPSMAST